METNGPAIACPFIYWYERCAVHLHKFRLTFCHRRWMAVTTQSMNARILYYQNSSFLIVWYIDIIYSIAPFSIFSLRFVVVYASGRVVHISTVRSLRLVIVDFFFGLFVYFIFVRVAQKERASVDEPSSLVLLSCRVGLADEMTTMIRWW